jgi:hypothetical protein
MGTKEKIAGDKKIGRSAVPVEAAKAERALQSVTRRLFGFRDGVLLPTRAIEPLEMLQLASRI